MTSKLKCAFCAYELQKNGLKNLCCPICGLVAPTKLWQALIQAKQDLEIARKALEGITKVRCGLEDWEPKAVTMTRIAENALEQISPNRN